MTDNEIEKASVIVLVYDVNNVECIKRLRTFWIPRIIKMNDKVKLFYIMINIDSYNFGRQ